MDNYSIDMEPVGFREEKDKVLSFTINLTKVKKIILKASAYVMVVSLIIGPTTPAGIALASEMSEGETIEEVVLPEEEVVEETTEEGGLMESLGAMLFGAPEPDFDSDGIPDATDLDDDNDGVTDVQEGNCAVNSDSGDAKGDVNPDCRDLDSDADGVWDIIEGNDANFDGHNDMGDSLDVDFDGQIDSDKFVDANNDGLHDPYAATPAVQQDTDASEEGPFSAVDRLDFNDDNDGLRTSEEDVNGNGRWYDDDLDCDGRPDYLDKTDDKLCSDFDGDGVSDSSDLDDDNDGVTDVFEGSAAIDSDDDGYPDSRDLDSDADGVWDIIEGNDCNTDGHNDLDDIVGFTLDDDFDGQIDDLKFVDANNNGLHDAYEVSGQAACLPDTDDEVESDLFKAIDRVDFNDDNDGKETNEEDVNGNGRWYDDDSDCDGRPDYLDWVDDDMCSLPDFDSDGIPDATDLDDDNDGVTDVQEGNCAVNSDSGDDNGDVNPDCRDLDSDADGVWDIIEGNDANFDGHNDMGDALDVDFDGQIDSDKFVDANNDGLHDPYAVTPAVQQDEDDASESDFFKAVDRVDFNDDNDSLRTIDEDKNGDKRWYNDDEDCDGRPDYLDAIFSEPGCGSGGNTPPTITLTGNNPFTFTVGGTFNDPGATANDAEDGNLTSVIVKTGDTVNAGSVGTYVITYTVTDSGGLSATTTRTVKVEPAGCTSNCGGGGGGGGGVVPLPQPKPEVQGTTTVTYALYITNPNGSQRHMGTPFVSTLEVDENGGHAFIGFEDSGNDFDHNDVVLQAIVKGCNLEVRAIGVYADWNHTVGIRLLDGDNTLLDTTLWGSTKGIMGQVMTVGRANLCISGPERIGLGGLQDKVTVNTADFVGASCSAFDYRLSLINPNGTVRNTGGEFVRMTEDKGTRTYRFEDRGDDKDFNDVVVVVTKNGCQLVAQITEVNAGWHHQLRMQLVDAQGANAVELVLWENTQEAIKNIPRTDTDGDGIPDYVERFLGTNPTKRDTDGDGFNDLDELLNGYSPLQPNKRIGEV